MIASYKKVAKIFSIACLIFVLIVIFIWFYRYRWAQIVGYGSSHLMKPASIEGFTDRKCYAKGDTVTFFIRSTRKQGKGILRRISAPYRYKRLDTFHFNQIKQPLSNKQASNGCNWDPSLRWTVNDSLPSGYYNMKLQNAEDTTNVTFLINNPSNKQVDVAILSPVSTWVAYNTWGGKSLYANGLDSSDVYFVASNRPTTSLNYTKRRRLQSIHTEAQIFNWFNNHYRTILYPDYALENLPQNLKSVDIIVLAYHCEYFSEAMYDNLEKLVYTKNKSLISLGGNQIYMKVQWDSNHNQMECHKDLTFFKNQWELGGNWRNNFRSEALFLGGRYTPAGLHTFAPYKVTKPDHWLFDGLDVEKGDLFGDDGINKYPLSGYETDKPTVFSRWGVTKIAKGLNPESGKPNGIYTGEKARNTNNQGGAVMTYKKPCPENGILNTASIQSGSGLGTDSVFTGIIQNFVKKFSTN